MTHTTQTQPIFLAVLLVATLAAAPSAAAQIATPAQTTAANTSITSPAALEHHRLLVVSVPDRKLVLLEDGRIARIYPVAVGKSSTPSPSGSFHIVRRVSNPTYSHLGRVVAPGPKNPVGSRWMGLSEKGYGIHGTNEPNSIGKAASHGCIRMGKADLEELYTRVQVGDAVEIRTQRDAVTSMALGAPIALQPPASAHTAPAVLFATTTAPHAAPSHAGE